MATISDDVLAGLDGFSGELLQDGDAGYEDARRVHNGLIDRRPALIARCLTVDDIVKAVETAGANGLELTVRGGGHNVAGTAVSDGGLMVDLAPMKAIDVDPEAKTVTAGPGVTWGELNEATQAHGLAVTGGVVSTTGIAGLTLGGGIGWLQPKYGLAADNLLSAQVVTADGRVLTASETENADLYWGLRGGGGNLGIVSSFEYRLHPVGPMIVGGLIVHPFDAAGDVLRGFRDAAADLSDDVMAVAALAHAPDGSGLKIAGLIVAHFGPYEEAERSLQPFKAIGSPLMMEVGPMPYSVLNTVLDENFPRGALNYWKSSFLEEFSDEAIDTVVSQFAEVPSPMTGLVFERFHGAAVRIPVEATAIPHRQDGYNLVITSVWDDPASTDENIAWTRKAFEALKPYRADRRYVNYLGDDDEGDDPVRQAYGPNYERLAALKAKYDPDNLFHANVNVKPS